ncbi:RDD family protein [Pleionea litopenaei]|uniref:RDD family protein n=1 Tax=Pleionea litopenaei TaxID=3070815 RepID=A0AA51X8F9_9GAMM|nr:RDD family protein [Pleionea sp. HL-JVS1]WMS88931.1 RDD family protein [Pleionea sp. HL-JVS1]
MDTNIYAPPQAEENKLEINFRPLASRWHRLAASIIDSIILVAVTVPIYYLSGLMDQLLDGEVSSVSFLLLSAAISIGSFILVNGYFLVRDGQTMGKKALGIQIVSMTNEPVSATTITKRYGFAIGISYIPFAGSLLSLIDTLFIFSESKRCLHDLVAGTQVVDVQKDEQQTPNLDHTVEEKTE